MDMNLYQYKAMGFRLPSADQDYAIAGLAGEVGELFSYLAKSIRDDYPLDPETIKKELGDILWFVAAIGHDFGFGLQDIAETNLKKLGSRQKRNKIKGSGDDR